MKKLLWILAVTGILVIVFYSITAHNWLISHNKLLHQDIPEGRKAAWSMLIMFFMTVPITLWIEMEKLSDKTQGNIQKGAWKRIKWESIFPYKDKFNLFLAQHQAWLYLLLLIPGLYMIIIIGLAALNMLVETVSNCWFKITCWWDDFKLMHL